MTCTVCGGDVVRIFVGTVEKYVHAVKGIDHGPLPTSKSAQDMGSPTRVGPARSRQPESRASAANT